jgi:hypothetical protein
VVADRDASALILLDDDLLVADRLDLPWPTLVRAHPGGGVWVVSATLGHPRAGHELRLVRRSPPAEVTLEVPAVLDLEVDAGGRAWLLTEPQAGGSQVLRAAPGAALERLDAPEGARGLALLGDRLGVAAGEAGFLLLGAAGAGWTSAWSEPGTQVLDAASGPGSRWWLLVRSGPAGSERVLVLDGSLHVAGAWSCAGCALVVPGPAVSSGAWALGGRAGWARRLDPGSRRWRELARLSALGANSAASDKRGGLLVAAGGALLRLDYLGRGRCGQGGFAFLADLDALAGW